MTFLQKSYSEYTQVEKPVVVTTSYVRLDEEEEYKKVPIINNNNNINIVTGSNSDLREEDYKNSKDNVFDEDVDDQLKFLPKPLSMQKWFLL